MPEPRAGKGRPFPDAPHGVGADWDAGRHGRRGALRGRVYGADHDDPDPGPRFCAGERAWLLVGQGCTEESLQVLAPYVAMGWWTAAETAAELLEASGRADDAIVLLRTHDHLDQQLRPAGRPAGPARPDRGAARVRGDRAPLARRAVWTIT
uniref:hypothetical protein n=1 Tax=Kitasatospora sp. NBC_01519 TaxID=2903576 RepID=UPI002F91621D